MTGGGFALWATVFCVGILALVVLSEIAISNRGRDPWAWILIFWVMGFPMVWVASVV